MPMSDAEMRALKGEVQHFHAWLLHYFFTFVCVTLAQDTYSELS